MNYQEAKLSAKVRAVNSANAYTLELYDKLVEIFTPLVGCKVIKADGCLRKEFSKLLPPLPNTSRLSVYRNTSTRSLSWSVKRCELIEGEDCGCLYYETGIYIADLNDGVITHIYDKPDLRSDYTVESLRIMGAAYLAAKKIANDLRSKLGVFEEYF